MFLKEVVVGKMLHDILHTAAENIAELINGINLHILIPAEAVKLGTVKEALNESARADSRRFCLRRKF